MTDDDYEKLDRLKWEGGLYWSDDIKGFYIPSDNIERTILEGAKKNRLGKDFAAALFCVEPEIPVEHALKGKSKDQIYADERYQIRKGVKIQQSRVISVRPMVPTGWTISFAVEFDESILNPSQVEKAMQEAGSLVGLGDWRPKFGRFIVEVEK